MTPANIQAGETSMCVVTYSISWRIVASERNNKIGRATCRAFCISVTASYESHAAHYAFGTFNLVNPLVTPSEKLEPHGGAPRLKVTLQRSVPFGGSAHNAAISHSRYLHYGYRDFGGAARYERAGIYNPYALDDQPTLCAREAVARRKFLIKLEKTTDISFELSIHGEEEIGNIVEYFRNNTSHIFDWFNKESGYVKLNVNKVTIINIAVIARVIFL